MQVTTCILLARRRDEGHRRRLPSPLRSQPPDAARSVARTGRADADGAVRPPRHVAAGRHAAPRCPRRSPPRRDLTAWTREAALFESRAAATYLRPLDPQVR